MASNLSPSNLIIDDTSMLDLFYPVGSIYETTNSMFNPGNRFGGTWQLIEDKFLVAAGSTFDGTITGNLTQKIGQIAHTHDATPTGTVSQSVTGYASTSGSTSNSSTFYGHTHDRGNLNVTGSRYGFQFYGTYSSDWSNGCWSLYSVNRNTQSPGSLYYTSRITLNMVNGSGLYGKFGLAGNHSHTGTFTGTYHQTSNPTFTGSNVTSSEYGEGNDFSIIPEYQAVYTWKRTA